MSGDSTSHVGEHATEKVLDEHVEPDHHVEVEQEVSPLELFFDLVFVFAFTQVTAFMAEDPSWHGLIRGMLILAAVWWSWVAYAWLTNNVDPEDERVRLTMFSVIAAAISMMSKLGGPTAPRQAFQTASTPS